MSRSSGRVAVVNNIIAPYRISLFNAISERLRERGHAVRFLFLSETESIRRWETPRREMRFDWTVLPVLLRRRNRRTATSDLIVNRQVFRHIRDCDLVLLTGYNYPTYFAMLLFCRLKGKTTMLFSESTVFDGPRRGGWRRYVKRKVFRTLFDGFLVPGAMARHHLRRHGVTKQISTAVNAVDVPEGRDAPNIETADRLLFVGRLSPEKGLSFLVGCLRSRADQDRLSLTIVGDGPMRVTLAEQEGLALRLVGHLSGDQLADAYRSHDVLILPSTSEPWGMVVNEAIGHGLAVLVSDRVGCGPELVQDNGCVFRSGDVEDFNNKLSYVLANVDRLKARSLEVAKRHTVTAQARAFCDAILAMFP